MADSVKDLGRKADNSETFDWAVRVGLVSYGAVHLLLAWLIGSLALGESEGKASKNGALAQVKEQPWGTTLLWVMAFGFVALTVWQLIDAVAGHRGSEGRKRAFKQATSVVKAGIYAFFAYGAWKVGAQGGGGKDGTEPFVAKILGLPAGQLLVALGGLAIAVWAAALIRSGITNKFTEHLSAEANRSDLSDTYVRIGTVGYIGKGIALLAFSGLILWAAKTSDPDKSGGLDEAMRKILEQPYGSYMLLAIAVGLACYGLFCFARARHLDR
ncbi:DUF1206 domain-containing protein [Aeromicrobium sp.]|uniref:DUF1206 domain-containing protein n=1 Tax=Aeromicrobium sp. TaxID=1871063 RepID=UPI002FCA8585